VLVRRTGRRPRRRRPGRARQAPEYVTTERGLAVLVGVAGHERFDVS
jgi:hypothetical protein